MIRTLDDEDLGTSTLENHGRLCIKEDEQNNKISDPVFYKLSQTHEVYSMKTMLLNGIETNGQILQLLEEDTNPPAIQISNPSEFNVLQGVFKSKIYNILSNISLIGPVETEFINKRMQDPSFDPWGVEEEEPMMPKEEIKAEERFSIGGDEDLQRYDDFDDGGGDYQSVASPMKQIEMPP